jgi:hypothetical protein
MPLRTTAHLDVRLAVFHAQLAALRHQITYAGDVLDRQRRSGEDLGEGVRGKVWGQGVA